MPTAQHHSWQLEGLSCANCAQKVEEAVGALSMVESAQVHFMSEHLSFSLKHPAQPADLEQIYQCIKQLEPQVTVRDQASGQELAVALKADQKGKWHSFLGRFQGESKWIGLRLVLSFTLFLLAIVMDVTPAFSLALYLLAYLIAGYDVLTQAVRNLFNGRYFDESFLMTIATLSAFYIQEYPEAVAVMVFYQVGELLQHIAVNRSRQSITSLVDLQVKQAKRLEGDNIQAIPTDQVEVGDILVIQPGEKVPVDGSLIQGQSTMDTSALTGESMPRAVSEGDELLSGFINGGQLIQMQAEKTDDQSAAKQILALVEEAAERKAPAEKFISRFARWYTPIVVLAASLIAFILPLVLADLSFKQGIYRACVFLVISCPCALVVSVPMGVFAGIGLGSKRGVLIKGGNYLQALADIQTVVFDKTGTLTQGQFDLIAVEAHPASSEDELLYWAAYTEAHSNHPIGQSILNYYNSPIDSSKIEDYQEIAGQGILAQIDGQEILAGNQTLMEEAGLACPSTDSAWTVVHLAKNGSYLGYLGLADQIKEGAQDALAALKERGVKQLVMLTGDAWPIAEKVGQVLAMDQVEAELLPQDKLDHLEQLMQSKGSGGLAFVGDGINDTAAISRADVGFAMGALGSPMRPLKPVMWS